MKTRTKILLTIALAVVVWALFGCEGGPSIPAKPQEHFVALPSPTEFGVTDLPYLRNLYATYNEAYFRNRLPKGDDIDIDLAEPKFMASTMCNDDGTQCNIKFNEKFTGAPRVADFTMLHEMCHVKTWGKDLNSKGEQADHGRVWRSCMLQLDAEGAFREIIIDNYTEDM
jgi:hypothetical protein